jgi:hypothetical protein
VEAYQAVAVVGIVMLEDVADVEGLVEVFEAVD